MSKMETVAFTGYRKLPNIEDECSLEMQSLKNVISTAIEQKIDQGYTRFMTGMADGFDLISAHEVLNLKSKYENIKLVCVVPFDVDRKRNEECKAVLEQADITVSISEKYYDGVYHTRNKYLVDNSNCLICYYDGLSGGTEYTVRLAENKGIEIVNIAPQRQINQMEMFDNVVNTVRDDLDRTIKKGSKIAIAGAYFSYYAYNELKKKLNNVDELRFIFTSPTFITEKMAKEKREFYIPRLQREKSLFGTEYEIKLRNKMTQKAIAKECADWIQKRVTFKSNVTNENMQGFINVETKETKDTYFPINGFTTIDIGCEKGNNMSNFVNKFPYPMSKNYLDIFDEIWNDKDKLQDVTNEVIEHISTAYKENSAEFIYYVTLYNIFAEFLEDLSEDNLPNEATGFKESKVWGMLYNFQKDAVLAIISKLEKYNGCILADSVGLGKTFTSLAVVKYYEERNKNVLVLCPKKLANNWNTYKSNYLNNPIVADRLRYDVLYHTDLGRSSGNSNGIELNQINWSNYDLVVIDESHNFRNGGKLVAEEDEKLNRYATLMNEVIKKGVKTKVLMLSATPVNNRFNDLKNQMQLAYEGDAGQIDGKLSTKRSINDVFKGAQTSFNAWGKLDIEERTTDKLLKMLDFDFFELLDSITIARSRKHIEKYYDTTEIGKFPTRLKPISLSPALTNLKNAINYNEIFEQLMLMNLSIYTPTIYIKESQRDKYAEIYGDNAVNIGFTQANREQGLKKLMSTNLMKRMESSVHSFMLTIGRIKVQIEQVVEEINNFDDSKNAKLDMVDMVNSHDLDEDGDILSSGLKLKVELCDMDYKSWKCDLLKDIEILEILETMILDITPEHDLKLQTLITAIKDKITNPINIGNKKIIIFTAFADTAIYLYDSINEIIKEKFGLDTAVVTGSIDGKSTIKNIKTDLNTVLTYFSPESKGKDIIMPNDDNVIDVLIATDCISEGQNLQDCDYLINYDIHWNPVRIIQRFGRVDRIGSKNEFIQLVNFWPDVSLDEYINLKTRVETRMRITVLASTGDDNYINPDEKGDLEYRRAQLERLKDEVVDIEEMQTGISIMDLGLNEFRLDLLEYVNQNNDLDKVPFGMHAVTKSAEDAPVGTIFVLKIERKVLISTIKIVYTHFTLSIFQKMEKSCVTTYLPKKCLIK